MTKEIIGVIGLIFVGMIVIASYPKIEINYYTKYNTSGSKEWKSTDFNITVNTSEVPSSSKICFRFKNTAEPLLQYVIPASNFKVIVTTDAECEDCNLYKSFDALQAQSTVDVCSAIKTSKNFSYINMKVNANWQGLSIPRDAEMNYKCLKVGEEGSQIIYFCRLLS